MSWYVPARIETERLILRRYEPDDAADVSRVVAANRDRVVRFLSWPEALPSTGEVRSVLVSRSIALHQHGQEFPMGIFERGTEEFIGGAGLHTDRGADALEIGYWIAADREGEGLITEAALALTRVALEVAGAERVEIWCDPTNRRAKAVARRSGYANQGVRIDEEGEELEVWAANASTLDGEPFTSVPLPRLADPDGDEIPWPV
ncbi:GNAT family N-acetyltransferase [Demequina rhizosphaerae]|uniref:GNAT family N-acetyltransferase n=1 Tax=Demequina rhizosphaerae TaxID=1638985 RepID=UPI0007817A4C|nr:GNAT family N-acetyltransferase [Demequina rhizosphaerae]